ADPWQFPGLPCLGEDFLGLGVRLGEGFAHRLHSPGSLVECGGEDVGEFAAIAVAQLPPRLDDEVQAIDLLLRERATEDGFAHSVEERRVHGSPVLFMRKSRYRRTKPSLKRRAAKMKA